MKRKIIIALTLFMYLAAHTQDVAMVKNLLNNERYSSAENMLEKKISNDADQPDLNYLLLTTYLEQQKTDEAKQFVEKYQLNKTNDADPMNQVTYASYLLNTGHKEEANAIFDAVLDDRKNRKNSELLTAIAATNIRAEKGDLQKAIDLLEQAEKRDKNNPEIDVLRGNAYRKMKDAGTAYQSYKAALQKDPMCLQAHYQLGTIFVSQKNSSLYLQHFMEAYYADSTYAPVLEALYDHYYFKDVNLAKKYLQKFIANSDYSVENDYRMTDMQYLTGEYENAINSAKVILDKEKDSAQARLYKLMAYSYEGLKDSVKALANMKEYFAKEDTAKIIAPDYEIMARLTATVPGEEQKAVGLYEKAFEIDTLVVNKVKYAEEMAKLDKEMNDYSNQAKWLGYIYENKEDKSNLDLFNWGLAHYNAQEYVKADTVFGRYTAKYPDNIYGYYWRAQVNAAIDTSLTEGLAIPYYEKMIEIGEKDKENGANKKMLIKAYGYLGGYEANTIKDYTASLAWFEKFLEIEPGNADATRYVDILKTWIAEGK